MAHNEAAYLKLVVW